MIRPWYLWISVMLMMAAGCTDDPPAEKIYIDGFITYQARTTADTLQLAFWDPSEETGPSFSKTFGAIVNTTVSPGLNMDHTISEYLVLGDVMFISCNYIPTGDTLYLRIFGAAGNKDYDTSQAYFSNQGGRLELVLN